MLLDDHAQLRAIDSHNFARQLDSLPDYLEAGWQVGSALPLPASLKRVTRIVIIGMGTAGLAGDMLAALVADSCNLPIMVLRSYELPAYVDGQATLVIAIAVTGTEEETLSALQLADDRGTQVLLMTPHAALAQTYEPRGVTIWPFTHEGEVRTALGLLLGLLVALVSRLGLVRNLSEDVQTTLHDLRSRTPLLGIEAQTSKNPAKRLAGQLIGRIPVIYASGLCAPIARRWKTQLNENAKVMAAWEEMPEVNYNASEGIIFPRPLMSKLAVIGLTSAQFDHPRVRLRQTLTKTQYLEQGIAVDLIKMKGESRLSQMFYGIQYGDYASYYVALCYGVDPLLTPALNELHERLATQAYAEDAHE